MDAKRPTSRARLANAPPSPEKQHQRQPKGAKRNLELPHRSVGEEANKEKVGKDGSGGRTTGAWDPALVPEVLIASCRIGAMGCRARRGVGAEEGFRGVSNVKGNADSM